LEFDIDALDDLAWWVKQDRKKATNKGFSGASGTFVDRSVSYTTGSVAGGDLIIVLSNLSSTGSHYHNVRLDATTTPEPILFDMLFAVLSTQSFRLARKASDRAAT
jgi:hypothetical protein